MDSAFTNEELQQMVSDKQIEINQVREEHLKLQNEFKALELRALKVFQENEVLMADPEIRTEMARMKYHLSMAEQFVKSGAFKAENAEQAYTLIQAGAEMGLKPVEAMQMLYIVNGAVRSYGDKMIAMVLKKGYKVEYNNETKDSVDVRVYHPDTGFDVTETAKRTDQVLSKSKALNFAAKNKLRFHGFRMVISFHLPHLFSSLSDEFTADFNLFEKNRKNKPLSISQIDDEKEKQRILDHINSCTSDNPARLLKVRDIVSGYGLAEEYAEKCKELNFVE